LKIISRKTFRKVVNVSDRLNIWFKKTFGLDAKRKVLEAKQDLTTMDELDRTIGQAIGTIDKFKDRRPQLSETLEYLKDK
jgi:DNA integrity scanning protein DisA with diadenylate cyclase activity